MSESMYQAVSIKDINEYIKQGPLMRQWAGLCIVWFFVEITVFTCFFGTMILLMIKSRLMNVGVDQSK